MAVRLLVSHKDPILRTPTLPFDFANPPMDPVQLYNDLAETMLHHNGLGLAANQIGVPYAVFVIRSDPVLGFFNPRMVDLSGDLVALDEGCLTYPGVIVPVARYRQARMRFQQADGSIRTEVFRDITAKVVQHEFGHLKGEVFANDVPAMELALAIKKAKKKTGKSYLIGDLRNVTHSLEIPS